MHKLVREIKRLGQHILCGFLTSIVLPFIGLFRRVDVRPNSLLIIRLDAPGDYIIFRNYLQHLRQSTTYQHHHITLLGNSIWQNIALRWDHPYVDQFIWLDPKRFRREAWYRFRIHYQLQTLGFETLIVPTYSRTKLMDQLAGSMNAKNKLAPQGDRTNLHHYPNHDSRCYYTKLCPSTPGIKLEYERNHEFMEHILSHKISSSPPMLPTIKASKQIKQKHPFAVLVPGAGHYTRQWSATNFSKIARILEQVYHLNVVLVGTSHEVQLGQKITQACPNVTNCIGQTKTDSLVEYLALSELIITNETAAVHIAAALGKKVICISNGSRFGRFHPYPRSTHPNTQFIYPPTMEAENTDYNTLVETYSGNSPLDINTITTETVSQAIEDLLQN